MNARFPVQLCSPIFLFCLWAADGGFVLKLLVNCIGFGVDGIIIEQYVDKDVLFDMMLIYFRSWNKKVISRSISSNLINNSLIGSFYINFLIVNNLSKIVRISSMMIVYVSRPFLGSFVSLWRGDELLSEGSIFMKETRPNKHPTDGNFRLISASTMLFYRPFFVKLKL